MNESDVDLTKIDNVTLAKEIVRRLSLFDPENVAHYRTEEVHQFAKTILDVFDNEMNILTDYLSEFSKQKEDLEHKLSFSVINNTLSDEEKSQLIDQVADSIILRRYTKDNLTIMTGFRDTFTRICKSIQKYNSLKYNGKSALYGKDVDGIGICSDSNSDTSYQKRLTHLFHTSVERIERCREEDPAATLSKVIRMDDTSSVFKSIADAANNIISQ